MAWYNNLGDLGGDIGNGVEDLLGQRSGMHPSPIGGFRPGVTPGNGMDAMNPSLPGSPIQSPLTAAVTQRMIGSGGGPLGDSTDPANPNNPSDPAAAAGSPNILSQGADWLKNHKDALSILGNTAGGVLALRQQNQEQKDRQAQIDLQRQYYALEARRQQAAHDAYQQLYAQSKYTGARPAPPAGTPMQQAQQAQQGVQQSVVNRLGY